MLVIGSSDTDKGNGPVTFHHNWYENVDSRTPLLRAATAHLFDNYYSHLNSSGINPRNGGRARVENRSPCPVSTSALVGVCVASLPSGS